MLTKAVSTTRKSYLEAKRFLMTFMFCALALVNAYAAPVLDLTGVESAVKEEVTGASPVIAVILGIVIALGVVIALIKRAK